MKTRSIILSILIMMTCHAGVWAQSRGERRTHAQRKEVQAKVQRNITGTMYDSGIYYNIIDGSYLEVAQNRNNESYGTDIYIPDTVHAEKDYPVCGIGRWAFSTCSNTATLRLPNTLKYIDDNGLYRCGVASLTIPSGVETIGNYAFEYMRDLQSITLPAGLKEVGDGIFDNCTSLASVSLDESNPNFKVVDNVLFTKDGKSLLAYPKGKPDATYDIPEGVETVRPYAIRGTNLEKVGIPASLNNLSYSALSWNYALEEVIVAEGNDCFYTENGILFSRSGNLLLYPASKPGNYYTIPEGIKIVGRESFYGTCYLKKLEIPSTVEQVDDYFCRQSSIDTIIVKSSVPPTASENLTDFFCGIVLLVPDGCVDTYFNADGWDKFVVVDSQTTTSPEEFIVKDLIYQKIYDDVDNFEVRVIGFAEYPEKAKNLSIPKTVIYNDVTYTVTEIAPFAFAEVYEINNVTIPNTVLNIGKYAFYGSSISKLTFSAGSKIEVIGKKAFSECYDATTFVLPSSLRVIQDYAFLYFGNWETNGSTLTIPQYVEHIGKGAFDNCNTISEFTVKNTNENFMVSNGALYNMEGNKLIAYPCRKPDETFYLPPTVDTILCDFNHYLRRLAVQNNVPPVFADGLQVTRISNIKVYVPAGTKEAYMADPVWQQFLEINEIAGSEGLIASGGHCLYNKELDAFLSRGAGWGMQASMEITCVPINCIRDELDGTYRMQYFDAFTNVFLGADGDPYTDKSPSYPITWDFQPTEDGRIILFNTGYQKWLKAVGLHQGCVFTDDISEATPFEFINNNKDYNNVLANRYSVASEITPTMEAIDVTDKLKNPTMATNMNYWNTNFTMQYTNGAVTNRSGLCELYHGYGSFFQNVHDLEPGIYKFSLEGFYRGGTNDMCAVYSKQGISLQSAIIFANYDEQPFATWASARKSDTYPNTMEEAYALISKGLYKTDVYTRVGDDGVLNVGLALPQGVYYSWLIWRNATLTYYRETVDVIQDIDATENATPTVYSISGIKQNGIKKGLNIVKDKNGKFIKVASK